MRVRLIRSAPFPVKELLPIEGGIAFGHGINGPRSFVRDEGERFTLPMVVRQAGEIFLGRRISPQAQDSGFRKSPLEMRIVDLCPGSAVAVARGCLGTFNQSARGHAILHAWKPVDVMDVVEQDSTHKLADARDGLPAIQSLRIVRLGRLDDGLLDIAEQSIRVGHEGEVDFDALRHSGLREPVRHTGPVGLVGQFLPDRGQIVQAVGLLDVREEFSTFTGRRSAAPQQVAGRRPNAPLRGP
jgi:hypothetical protein